LVVLCNLILGGQAFTNDKYNEIIIDYVNSIELNHYYDEHGKLVFDQFVFWGFNDHVREWRLSKNGRKLVDRGLPLIFGDPYFVFNFQDKYVLMHDNGRIYKIYYTSYYRTWTQYDVELYDRELYPKEWRVPFRKSKNKYIKG
jgi:hypothetical protein